MIRLAALALSLAIPRSAPLEGAEGPPTHVQARNIEYQYRQRRTVMTGDPVVFTREDAVLVCKKLTADNDEAGGIRVAVCEGDVKLTRGERSVTCARATYYGPQARVVCRGDPVLRDGPSVVHSQEVTYDLDQDRVFVKRAKGIVYKQSGQGGLRTKEKAK